AGAVADQPPLRPPGEGVRRLAHDHPPRVDAVDPEGERPAEDARRLEESAEHVAPRLAGPGLDEGVRPVVDGRQRLEFDAHAAGDAFDADTLEVHELQATDVVDAAVERVE